MKKRFFCGICQLHFMRNNKYLFYSLGNYKMCERVTVESTAGSKYTCNYMCDVTTTATTQLKITSSTLDAENPAICDIKVLWREVNVNFKELVVNYFCSSVLQKNNQKNDF